MVLSLRQELAGSGVKAGIINPGAVDTKWWTDAHRGGKRGPSEIPANRLPVTSIAEAVMVMALQPAAVDMERIVLDPATAQ